jgi:hypothetical protein
MTHRSVPLQHAPGLLRRSVGPAEQARQVATRVLTALTRRTPIRTGFTANKLQESVTSGNDRELRGSAFGSFPHVREFVAHEFRSGGFGSGRLRMGGARNSRVAPKNAPTLEYAGGVGGAWPGATAGLGHRSTSADAPSFAAILVDPRQHVDQVRTRERSSQSSEGTLPCRFETR